MKTIAFAALLFGAAAPALAQTAPAPAPTTAPAPAKFSADTPIQDIVADPAAKAVLDKNLPGLTGLPEYEMFKGLSLKQVQAYSNGKLTDAMIAKTNADLAEIK